VAGLLRVTGLWRVAVAGLRRLPAVRTGLRRWLVVAHEEAPPGAGRVRAYAAPSWRTAAIPRASGPQTGSRPLHSGPYTGGRDREHSAEPDPRRGGAVEQCPRQSADPVRSGRGRGEAVRALGREWLL